MAGISYGPRVTLNYRNQWSALGDGFNGGYTTYMAGFDMHIQPMRGGVGVLFTGDQIAHNLLASYRATVMYSQQIKFNRHMALKIGLSGSYIYTRLKWSDLLWSDMINPYTGFYNNINIPNPTSEPTPARLESHRGDMGAGVLFFTEKLYVGVAVNNLLMRKEGFTAGGEGSVPIRITAHLGANLPVKHRHQARYNIWLSPNVIFENQGQAFHVEGNFLAGISFVYFGLGYRNVIHNSDAVIGFLGVKKGKFKVGYSYDYTISKLMNRSGGSHELSFIFNWSGGDDNSLNPKANKGYVPCPDILR